MLTRLTIACLIFVCSMNVSAARGFFIKKAELVTVEAFHDGTQHVLLLRFKVNPDNVDESKMSCGVTWENGQTLASDIKLIGWRNAAVPITMTQMFYSTALAAQVQSRLVDIYVRNDICGVYGHGFAGIRFSE